MPNEVEQRLKAIEEQLSKAKPPYDLIPCDCGDPDCNRAFIGVGADLDTNLCGGFRREDAELMTQAPETLRFLLSLLREREEENKTLSALFNESQEENKHLRHLLDEIERGTDDIREGLHGCGDHSCIVQKPLGMATNGGCRCVARNWFEGRVLIGRAVRKAERLEEENRKLREALASVDFWYRRKKLPCGQAYAELPCGHVDWAGAPMCKCCTDEAIAAALRGEQP